MGADVGETTGGRTRWRVFGLVLLVGVFGVGLMFTGLSQGAIAASFAVAGTSYKASADRLDAQGVVQYGSVDRSADQAHPVLVNGFRKAKLDNFCQSIVVPGLPAVGDITVKIAAPGGMSADNLVLGIEEVTGDITLNNVEIGRDAGTMDKGPNGAIGDAGTFGIQADSTQITGLRQVAWSTTASTLKLNQVQIKASVGRDECF
ncbi:cholesterol esterase [Saccharopolyspora endophytica]|uniref:Cholesterol esterase n=1 Tax=Saccharopolyspora endophytica TaxID=543886 RepID=A0ABS5DMG6_9PSEU|nr:cholesterol esterase [Saccharopolyspora endophytica]